MNLKPSKPIDMLVVRTYHYHLASFDHKAPMMEFRFGAELGRTLLGRRLSRHSVLWYGIMVPPVACEVS